MICQAAVFTRRLLSGDELTQEELMQMEIAVRKGCPYQKIFIESLDLYCIMAAQNGFKKNDPTSQEQDRKAGKWWMF